MVELEVLQNMLVFGAVVEATCILVDVYGSGHNVCGSVRLDLAAHEQPPAFDLLDHWRRNDTPLTLISGAGTVVLQNDHAVFAAQLAPAGPAGPAGP
jgi:hypothetical protein